MLLEEEMIFSIYLSLVNSIRASSLALAKVSPEFIFLFKISLNSQGSSTRVCAILVKDLISPHSEPKNRLLTISKEFKIDTEPYAKNSAEETA